MKKAMLLSMLVGATGALADLPDPDTTYFHPAASLYIHGDSTAASNLVAKGLSVFPDDGKLKRLKELIEKQQEQQQNQDQENQENQKQDQQQDEQQQDQQDQNEQQQDGQNQEQPEQETPQPEPAQAEQMSQDEAERLLDAMKQEEETKRLQLHPVLGAPVKVDKDW